MLSPIIFCEDIEGIISDSIVGDKALVTTNLIDLGSDFYIFMKS